MKQFRFILLALICLFLFSCSHHITVVYFNDNSKVDDGEIFGEELSNFFHPDKNIYVGNVHSTSLQRELTKISDTLKLTGQTEELDDGYYGFAFITQTKDTLYADYSLDYWRSNKKWKAVKSEKLKTIMKPVFENPYLKN